MVTLKHAIDGYLLHAGARRLSPATLDGYRRILDAFAAHFPAGQLFDEITVTDVETYLNTMEDRANQTVRNHHNALASLWTWATNRKPPLCDRHILHEIPRPQPDDVEIVPLTENDVRALLRACGKSRPYKRPGKKETVNAIPTAARDRAIILLLLDTGIRVSELCDLRIINTELKNHRILIKQGKGNKDRIAPISDATGEAIWTYLGSRPNARLDEPTFVGRKNAPLNRHSITNTLRTIGKRAGVNHVHAHRFRHTFAINYLRNGGDPFTLQEILGHSTMDMVKRYITLANTDIQTAHRRASPVANWHL